MKFVTRQLSSSLTPVSYSPGLTSLQSTKPLVAWLRGQFNTLLPGHGHPHRRDSCHCKDSTSTVTLLPSPCDAASGILDLERRKLGVLVKSEVVIMSAAQQSTPVVSQATPASQP